LIAMVDPTTFQLPAPTAIGGNYSP
jgi:hypothetical protein